MSRIEAGRLALHNVPFCLQDLLDDLEAMFRVRAEEKGLSLSLERDAKLPGNVVGDEAKLRPVLVNMTGNAVKFTKEGEIFVSAEPVRQEEHKATLRFTVRDTGIGMSPEEIERLKLEDGVRLHESVKVELETYARESGREIVKPFLRVGLPSGRSMWSTKPTAPCRRRRTTRSLSPTPYQGTRM